MSHHDEEPIGVEEIERITGAKVMPSASYVAAPLARQTVLPPPSAEVPEKSQPQRGDLDTARARLIVLFSPTIGKLALALAKAQGEFLEIGKAKTAEVKSKDSDRRLYSYDYETLADVFKAVRPALSKNNLAIMQFPFAGERSMTVRTMLIHGESGEWIQNDISCAIFDTMPQTLGSAMAYLKRYAVKSVLGVAADDEDDDGEAAQQGASYSKAVPLPTPRPSKPTAVEPAASDDDEPASTTPPPPSEMNIGKVLRVDKRADGKAAVTLDTGFRAGTRDADVIKALENYSMMKNGPRVSLVVRPSASPQFLPVIEEVTITK